MLHSKTSPDRRSRRATWAVVALLTCAGLPAVSGVSGGVAGAQGAEAGVAGIAPGLEVRIAGPDRVATAEAVAGAFVRAGGRAEAVVVVPRDQTAIALSTAGLAGSLGTVTLLSDVPPRASTVAAARSLGAARAVVVGGAEDLATAWAAAGLDVDHVAAPGGPPAVAAAVGRVLVGQGTGDGASGEEGTSQGPSHAYLAGTGGLPDALAVGPLAREAQAPLLLTAAGALDPHTRFLIEQTGITAVTVLGGEAVVGEPVAEELRAMGVQVARVAGADREGTALALAADRPAQRVLLAAGDDPADAVGAAALADVTGAIILPPGGRTRAWLAERCGSAPPITVVGGVAAVPDDVEASHRAAAQRCDGLRSPMAVRVAVATPGAPGAEQEVLDAITGPAAWGSRRVRFTAVGEDPHLGVIVGGAGACGGHAVCRIRNDMVIDGQAWHGADQAGRRRLVHLVVGAWAGEAVVEACAGGVMDAPSCASAGLPTDADRQRVADRFVPTATLSFAGDVHGERHIATAVAQGRNVLEPVAAHLGSADLAILNLETPLSTRGTPASKTYVFRGPPGLAADLVEAGVDIVSLANNHALDYGIVALSDTFQHTGEAGLATVGAGGDAAAAYAPVLRDTPAGRVAVIGLTRVLHTRTWEATPTRPGLASAYDEAGAVAAVQAARAVADHVVVAIHWGTERADCPDASQRHLARLLTDAGADVVVGHHPHVLQGVQRLGGSLVAYSMGNFAWYHNSAPSRFTGILDVELPLLDDPRWSFDPAEIGTDGSPHPAGGTLGEQITNRLLTRSPGGSAGCAFP